MRPWRPGGTMDGVSSLQSLAFGVVVVLAMFAAETFDPRLIWDPIEERRG